MKTETKRILECIIIVLMMTFYYEVASAFPVSTTDLKRIAQTAKSSKKQIDIYIEDGKHVISVGKQIQQGGFAAGASLLFAEASSGRYDRYGSVFTDAEENMKVMGASLKASVSKKDKRAEMQQKIAKMEAERKLNAEKQSQKLLDIQSGKIAENEKHRLGKKIYSFVRKHGGDTASLITEGAEIAKTGSVKGLVKDVPDFAEDFADAMKKTDAGKKYMDKKAERAKRKAKEKIVFEVPDGSDEIPLDLLDDSAK